jgi:hypothetical protein
VREFTLVYQLFYHGKLIWNLLPIPLCYVACGSATPRIHMLDTWTVALEESECLQCAVLLHMEHNEVITVRHVQIFVSFARCVEHVQVRVLLEVGRV